MKKIATYLLSTLCVVASALPASAAWYEVTGTATVVSSDELARIHALEDAIYRAVGFAGADIGSISNLTPFLESNRKEYQFTGHEVRTILIEQQKVRGGVMQVKAKIDIYPSASTCV
ncbi:flagellar protein FlgT [Vibrio astriarenae]|nr:flagellar protein FlgT [Vibrio sp. C7]